MLEAPRSLNISALEILPALRNLVGSTASDACRTGAQPCRAFLGVPHDVFLIPDVGQCV